MIYWVISWRRYKVLTSLLCRAEYLVLLNTHDNETKRPGRFYQADIPRFSTMNLTVRYLFFPCIVGLFLFLFIATPLYAEEIKSFDSTIELQSDSSFIVTENIRYDFGEQNRHGIFRYITTDHPQDASAWYKDRYINIDVTGVKMDSSPVPYEVSQKSDQIYLKVGDPNSTLSGAHSYEIAYIVRGGLSYLGGDEAELYWNVTGAGWEIPILSARMFINDPQNVLKNERACYSGYSGESTSCERAATTSNGVIFSAGPLMPGEEFTVANAVDGSRVDHVVLERTRMFFFAIPILIFWLGVLSVFVYRYRTAYRTGRTIIPQYEPYENFKPMYSGLLIDGTLHPRDITACIVYLAEQGFLKIQKTTGKVLFFFEVDDFQIQLHKPILTIESDFQRKVLELLFGQTPVEGDKVTLGSLKTNLSKQRENQKILQQLRKDLEKDLRNSGFFQTSVSKLILLIAATFLGALLYVVITTYGKIGSGFVLVGIFVAASLAIISFMYRRRTRKGYEALDHLEGFKQFLSVTEKERYAFHNAPEKSPEQFMEYLPYAIAFGVEKKWAELFKNITIPDPTWYDGGSVGSFSATNLTSSLGAFSTAFAASSGSSGSGGGGSAGGGGGGGGGGSW